MVKTAHSCSLKHILDETVKYFPGNTWITMESKTKTEEVDLVCVGYKYNNNKLLICVFTKGTGSTALGE